MRRVARVLVGPGPAVLLCLGLLGCGDSQTTLQAFQTLALDEGCKVRSGCTGRHRDLSVSVRMSPHRSALKPFAVVLSSTHELRAVTLSLEMRGMDMGQNRYRLLKAEDGNWHAQLTLPVCTSGRSDWMAVFTVQDGAQSYRLELPFSLGD